jgi:WXXGXW repeat (2 copies)
MKKLTLVRAMLVTVGLPILAGCASPTRTTVYQTQPSAGRQTIIVQHPTEPPAIPAETRPQPPDTEYVWVKGAWEWHGGRWVWVPGHWEQPHPGQMWAPSHWQRTDEGYVWVPGHWQ